LLSKNLQLNASTKAVATKNKKKYAHRKEKKGREEAGEKVQK